MLKVRHIENGTVIDHLAPGRALDALRVLGLGDDVVILAMNVSSRKYGKKDILKMENVFPEKEKLDLISLFSPNATVNVIKNGKVVEKWKVQVPEVVEGVLKCMNPRCVTNRPREPVRTKFIVEKDPIRLRCIYCNQEFDIETLVRNSLE